MDQMIDLDLADKLVGMDPPELADNMVALLVAVEFDYTRFSEAIRGEDELVYHTSMQLFAQRWKEQGKPVDGLDDLVFQWRVITA